jgi:hypothetical protein
VDVDVRVAYRLIGVHDSDVDEAPPAPREAGHPWLGAGTSSVLLQSAAGIYRARLTLTTRSGRAARSCGSGCRPAC